MNIKKIGHCCLLIKTKSVTLLTDPGAYTIEQNSIQGIDAVLITHEHGDHLHIDSLKEILKNNPGITVMTNTSTGKKLDEVGIQYVIVEGRGNADVKGVSIEAFDGKHEEIFEEIGQVQNTGYFIDKKLFYPGDSFHNPQKSVDVLALPVGGPWCKIGDAIRYAIAVKPKKTFPVHDSSTKPDRRVFTFRSATVGLTRNGIEFVEMNEGDEKEF